MPSQFIVRDDGSTEWIPDDETVARARHESTNLFTSGRLCTACLIGSWPRTHLRSLQVICDTCVRLGTLATRRAGLDARLDVARRGDDARERAEQYRTVRLAEVFDRAERVDGGTRWMARADGSIVREADRDHLHRPDVLDASYPARVERFAAWLQALAPHEYALRAEALSDVDGLAAALESAVREVAIANARSAVRDARRASMIATERLARARTELQETEQRPD